MPKGPRGEKRPADVIGAAVMVARIATGEIEDAKGKTPNRAKGGKIGRQKRAERLSKAERTLIAPAGPNATTLLRAQTGVTEPKSGKRRPHRKRIAA